MNGESNMPLLTVVYLLQSIGYNPNYQKLIKKNYRGYIYKCFYNTSNIT